MAATRLAARDFLRLAVFVLIVPFLAARSTIEQYSRKISSLRMTGFEMKSVSWRQLSYRPRKGLSRALLSWPTNCNSKSTWPMKESRNCSKKTTF